MIAAPLFYELGNATLQIHEANRRVRSTTRNDACVQAFAFSTSVGPDTQWSIELASEKGSSNWLTCCPLLRHGFKLTNGEFPRCDLSPLLLGPTAPPVNLPVWNPSPCSMLCHAPLAVLPPSDTTRSGTSQRAFESKLLIRCRWNPICNLSRPSTFTFALPTVTIRLGWMLLPVAFEEDYSSAHLFMYGCLTLVRPRIIPSHLPPAMSSMRARKRGPMSSGYLRLNMHHSFRPCSLLVAEWVSVPPRSTCE